MNAAHLAPVALIGITAYTLWLATRAFGRSARFASWHMFAGVKHAEFELSRASVPNLLFNPWDLLPHSEIKMSDQEVRLFLYYVSRVHGITDLHGRVVIRDGAELTVLAVKDSNVVG